MKDICWQMKTKGSESNNNHLPGRRVPSTRTRFKKRLAILLHTHVALICLCTLSVLDAGCVIGQIISDILIMKDELHEKQLMEKQAKRVLVETFPVLFNDSVHDSKGLDALILDLKHCKERNKVSCKYPVRSNTDPATQINAVQKSLTTHVHQDGTHHVHHRAKRDAGGDIHHRYKRGAGGDHSHDFQDEKKYAEHHILHELTHAFHLGSMVILTVLLVITKLKILAMGKKFLAHKIEVFDAFVVLTSWALDIVFWKGLWAHPETEAANIMIFILPWRVIRIVNSFVMVIQEKDQVQLKIVKQQYRGSVKRASDMKMKVELYRIEMRHLQSLCRRRGATEKEIQACAPEGKSRRRSSLLPVLTRLASVGLLGSVSSSADLTKEAASNDTSDEEDSTVDISSRPNSNYSNLSNYSSDSYSLARTISTGSTISTVFSGSLSTDNLARDNVAYVDEVPPTYTDVSEDIINEEDCNTHL